MASAKEQRIADNKKYLEEHFKTITRSLAVDLLKEKPDDVIQFIYDWCKKKGAKDQTPEPETPIAPPEEQRPAEPQTQPEEAPPAPEEAAPQEEAAAPEPKGDYQAPAVTSSEEEEEEDEVDMEEFMNRQKAAAQKTKTAGGRASVSAEVFGKFNKKEAFVPKVVPKNAEQEAAIRNKLEQSFMFKMLEESEKKIVVDAMEERRYKKGDYVIKQGDDGDVLFLVDTGLLKCYKEIKDQEDKFLVDYKPGMAFGELALLYNAPRAASIIADEDCLLWSLDRACFNNIVKESSVKRRERFEAFVQKIELLSDLDPYERTKLCDVLAPATFKAGEKVITMGDIGHTFFFIETGEAIATKPVEGKDGEEETVFEYKQNDYFGELALLRDEPRAANIVAKTDIKVCSIDRDAFSRLLGPLTDLLKRNVGKYAKYIEEKNAE